MFIATPAGRVGRCMCPRFNPELLLRLHLLNFLWATNVLKKWNSIKTKPQRHFFFNLRTQIGDNNWLVCGTGPDLRSQLRFWYVLLVFMFYVSVSSHSANTHWLCEDERESQVHSAKVHTLTMFTTLWSRLVCIWIWLMEQVKENSGIFWDARGHFLLTAFWQSAAVKL